MDGGHGHSACRIFIPLRIACSHTGASLGDIKRVDFKGKTYISYFLSVYYKRNTLDRVILVD